MLHAIDPMRVPFHPSPFGKCCGKYALTWLAIATTLASCGERVGDTTRARSDAPNILLITVDTLRADHVGAWGYERNTSPSMDAFAAKSIVFERAYAPAPWTKPSVASLHTGLYPSAHTIQRPRAALPEEVVTIAEILQSEGWSTASVTSNSLLAERFGYGQGFDFYDTGDAIDHAYISTPGVTKTAKDFLADFSTSDKPFFLSVLYFDPHYDWLSHDKGFAAESAGRLDGGETIHELRDMAKEGAGLATAELALLRDRYDEEIRFTDDGIGDLLAELEKLGLAKNTVVLFTADHGEEFMEHGWLGHTRFLYDGMIHVPLAIFDPRTSAAPPQRISQPVSTVSVTPTIVELAGLDEGKYEFGERSLAPLVRGSKDFPFGLVFSEVNFKAAQEGNEEKEAHFKAVIDGTTKFIRVPGKPIFEAYDTSVDPQEQDNLMSGPEAGALRLKYNPHIANWTKTQVERAYEPRTVIYTDQDLERMRDLGYLDSAAD